MTDKGYTLDFHSLVDAIQTVHAQLTAQAGRAVNISLTLRNWVIGYTILEYEQSGSDRARYGESLLESLADELKRDKMNRVSARELRRYRQFYLTYPRIWESATPKFRKSLFGKPLQLPDAIRESVIPEFNATENTLVSALSFTHFAELISIGDPQKRQFYEIACIRGAWSVRELKRQIASLYYERTALSENKEKLASEVQDAAEKVPLELSIRDPYVFEFLGLKPREVMYESDLEDALLDKLEEFLLELGHGFCFEARQKRILIGDTYSFVDLVFYHRILKCHVLLDLKLEGFSHENIGQLNTYVSWFRKNMMEEGDNPPVGILLCTRKDQALVEYALAGMDNNLFVSKYQLALPDKNEMQRFLETTIREVEEGE